MKSEPRSLTDLKSKIRDIPDFPKPGILFKDITPLLSDGESFRAAVHDLAKTIPQHTTKIVAIESRGFILGAAIAHELNLGLVLVRKPGKLPYSTFTHSYDLEYGKDALQIHVDALNPQDHICIVDDVLATGGTASAAETLCLKTGATVTSFAFLMELGFLNGKDKLKAPIHSLLRY